ncbi:MULTISPECIES: hypothetical protein [unclassified Curtobacterium]|uniref:hypothetical protein n=1 Tax=unclassified Curtobacterium TaxID=257496 RepID=UPI0008DE1490|nr:MULTISPECIES: hypothetical protein [unclassified Curtobacterium]OIH93226.1 hypothetical protein BIU92_10395 [Curtobacterium sp. MCBA15_003]OII10485.1 hypothetical protein BIU97_10165 [Curtobacterium sp. MCBA15_009]OII30137.1 hypothetical protein BIU94_11125 [Curtobacterium sp. MMLR14_006]
MTVVMTVGELLAAFRPVAEQMLRPDEFRSARFWVGPHGDWELDQEQDDVVDGSMSVVWTIVGETQGSRSLPDDVDDLAGLLHDLADDLQDFIAESSFGWGELRPIPSLGQ